MTTTAEAALTRDAWLTERRLSIGSSDAPVLWGYGYSSQSLYATWANKVHGVSPEWSKSDLRRLALGKAAEPVIREWFADETGLAVGFDGDHVIRRHPTIEYLTASLDGHTIHEDYGFCPVELKKIGRHNQDEWFDECANPVAPLRYQVQLAHQMIVTGATHGWLAGLIGDDDLQIREVALSEEFAAQHLERCREFWGYVERQEAPPVDASTATAEALKLLYPHEVADEIVDLPIESDDWTFEIGELGAEIKSLEERVEQRKNEIRAALGVAVEGITPGGQRWTWRTQDRAGYYVEPKSFRVLRKSAATRGRKK